MAKGGDRARFESLRVRHPDRVPVVALVRCRDSGKTDRRMRLMVPPDLTVGSLQCYVRRSERVDAKDALLTLVDGCMHPANTRVIELDRNRPYPVYAVVQRERTFG